MREQQWDWAKHRLVGFMAIRSFNVNPKDIPKKESDVIQLDFVDGGNSIGVMTEAQKIAMDKAKENYFKELKLKAIEQRI